MENNLVWPHKQKTQKNIELVDIRQRIKPVVAINILDIHQKVQKVQSVNPCFTFGNSSLRPGVTSFKRFNIHFKHGGSELRRSRWSRRMERPWALDLKLHNDSNHSTNVCWPGMARALLVVQWIIWSSTEFQRKTWIYIYIYISISKWISISLGVANRCRVRCKTLQKKSLGWRAFDMCHHIETFNDCVWATRTSKGFAPTEREAVFSDRNLPYQKHMVFGCLQEVRDIAESYSCNFNSSWERSWSSWWDHRTNCSYYANISPTNPYNRASASHQ